MSPPFAGGGFSGGGFGRAPGTPGQPDGTVANGNSMAGPTLTVVSPDGATSTQAPGGVQLNGVVSAVQNALNWTAQAAGVNADPWANGQGGSQQANGVAAYGGGFWASKNCPPCHEAIKTLQAELNRTTSAAGAPANLSIDGLVGTSTANAVTKIADIAQKHGWVAESFQLSRVGGSPEQTAKYADAILPYVRSVGDRLGAANNAMNPSQFPMVPAGGQQPMTPPGQQASAMPAIFPKWRQYLPYIIGGSILAAGIGVAVVIAKKPLPSE